MSPPPFRVVLTVLGVFSFVFFVQFEFYQSKISNLEAKINKLQKYYEMEAQNGFHNNQKEISPPQRQIADVAPEGSLSVVTIANTDVTY
jgi:hypothetical protein